MRPNIEWWKLLIVFISAIVLEANSIAGFRFLMDKNSNIFLFASRAYLENISANKRIIDRPLSFGSGISFETKAGIFNLTYALGKQLNNPLLLR